MLDRSAREATPFVRLKGAHKGLFHFLLFEKRAKQLLATQQFLGHLATPYNMKTNVYVGSLLNRLLEALYTKAQSTRANLSSCDLEDFVVDFDL